MESGQRSQGSRPRSSPIIRSKNQGGKSFGPTAPLWREGGGQVQPQQRDPRKHRVNPDAPRPLLARPWPIPGSLPGEPAHLYLRRLDQLGAADCAPIQPSGATPSCRAPRHPLQVWACRGISRGRGPTHHEYSSQSWRQSWLCRNAALPPPPITFLRFDPPRFPFSALAFVFQDDPFTEY